MFQICLLICARVLLSASVLRLSHCWSNENQVPAMYILYTLDINVHVLCTVFCARDTCIVAEFINYPPRSLLC